MLYIDADHIGEGTYAARVFLDDDNAHEGRTFIADGKNNAITGLVEALRSEGFTGRIIGHGIRD